MISEYRNLEEDNKNRWNEIYKKHIDTSVDKTLPGIINIFKKYKVKKVLDLACGSGRHTLYLAKKGFDVYGIDISGEAIRTARYLLEKNNLYSQFTDGSMYERLSYTDSFFDGIICIRSFNHGTIQNIRKAIKEIQRVLKPKGLIYLTVRKKVIKTKRLAFKEIAPRTYVPLEGREKGIVHYLFNRNLLRKEFHNFKIHKLWAENGPKDWESYYCLLAQLKD